MAGSTDSTGRSRWLKTLHQWHWISSAICLLGMLLFAATGITLNHAAAIDTHPQVTNKKAQLPEALVKALAPSDKEAASAGGNDNKDDKQNRPVPEAIAAWVGEQLGVDLAHKDAEWSPDELYVALPRPGGDAWLRIDRASGDVEYELTDRGWISYLNDLHKGRNTGTAWSWFIDVFALACLVFSITGLLILKLHAAQRAMTWPMVGLGLLIPLLLALLFIH